MYWTSIIPSLYAKTLAGSTAYGEVRFANHFNFYYGDDKVNVLMHGPEDFRSIYFHF